MSYQETMSASRQREGDGESFYFSIICSNARGFISNPNSLRYNLILSRRVITSGNGSLGAGICKYTEPNGCFNYSLNSSRDRGLHQNRDE